MQKLTRKDFIKGSSIAVLATAFGLSKLGNLGSVKAAVSDNSTNDDISNDVIYIDSEVQSTDVFTSGQSAKRLAESVNEVNKSLTEKIEELYNSFSLALADLKNTAVAKAINAVGTTFPKVIDLLAKINVYTNSGTEDYATSSGNITVTSVDGADIPEGFYSNGLGLEGDDPSHISIDRKSLLSEENLRDSGIRTVTDNGVYSTLKDEESAYESIVVDIDKDSEGIGNTIYNEGYDQATTDIFSAAQAKTVTATTSTQVVSPDSSDLLLSQVTVKPQEHTEAKTITANGRTNLGAQHNIKYIDTNIPTGSDEVAISYCRHHSNNANFIYNALSFWPQWSHASSVSGNYLRAYDDYSNSSVSKLQITILQNGYYYDSMSGQKRYLSAGTVIQKNVTTDLSEEYILVAHYSA